MNPPLIAMSTETESTPPFDREAVRAAIAFTTPPPALLPTLREIWEEVVNLLKRAEHRSDGQQKKIWGNTPLPAGDFSALERASLALNKDLLASPKGDLIVYAYLNALKCIHRIKEAFYELHPLTAPLGDENPDTVFIRLLVARDNLKEEPFLNLVVTPFFALQTQAAFLRSHLEVPVGVPLSKAVSQSRASKGGQGASRGKEAVQEVIISCLESASAGEIYNSPTALGRACFAAIETALNKHRAELNQRFKAGEDGSANYAFSLSAEGVIKKLTAWSKENAQFRERLAKLCKLKD